MNENLTTLITTVGLVVGPIVLAAVDSHGDASHVYGQRCVVDPPPGDDTANGAPVHAAYQGRGDVIAHLPDGEQVTVIATRKNWRRIIYGPAGSPGWLVQQRLGECEETTSATGATRKGEGPAPTGPGQDQDKQPARIDIQPITSTTDLHRLGPVPEGEFRVHLIDVGTGLAMLIQGYDFAMLFDAGSGDDKRGISAKDGNRNRLIAYLWAVLGPSGPADCVPVGDAAPTQQAGAEVRIHHAVLSHPHDDHGSLLADVLHCYRVDHVWDVGVVNHAAFYEGVLQAIAVEPGVSYHTAVPVPAKRSVTVRSTAITFPPSADWTMFDEGEVTKLGDNATFTILHADGEDHHDFNENSIVLRVELGGVSMLLTGDAESGARKPPPDPAGDIEAHLLARHRKAIDVDILQVGHHGSMTSSRQAFLDAVSPQWALIGAGPKSYSGKVLPDPVIVETLEGMGARVLRTDDDEHRGCPVTDKVGDDDTRPGGCASYVLTIEKP